MIERIQTEVTTEPVKEKISYSSSVLTSFGSCFSDEIGSRMKRTGFDICVNPFGTLYNPESIRSSIERLVRKKMLTDDEIIESHGIFTSYFHHSSFARNGRIEFLEYANGKLEEASAHLERSTDILITLGTARIYRLKENGITVSNCHKKPASLFERTLLSPDEVYGCLADIRSMLNVGKRKRIFFTVSPIRHIRDGLHGNQISKATLLLATERLCSENMDCIYFPAYEMFMDELRDYRYYAEDMVHPSSQAADYIWKRFCEFSMDNETIATMKEAEKIRKSMEHRPLFPDTDEWKRFSRNLEKRLEDFMKRHPDVKMP